MSHPTKSLEFAKHSITNCTISNSSKQKEHRDFMIKMMKIFTLNMHIHIHAVFVYFVDFLLLLSHTTIFSALFLSFHVNKKELVEDPKGSRLLTDIEIKKESRFTWCLEKQSAVVYSTTTLGAYILWQASLLQYSLVQSLRSAYSWNEKPWDEILFSTTVEVFFIFWVEKAKEKRFYTQRILSQ